MARVSKERVLREGGEEPHEIVVVDGVDARDAEREVVLRAQLTLVVGLGGIDAQLFERLLCRTRPAADRVRAK